MGGRGLGRICGILVKGDGEGDLGWGVKGDGYFRCRVVMYE